MKNLSKIFLFCILLITASNCTEDWLEPQPLSFFSPNKAISDKAGAEGLLLSARESLRGEDGGKRIFVTEYVWTDIALGSIWIPSGPRDAVLQVIPTYPLTHGFYPVWFFEDSYKQINNVNIIISRIDEIQFNSEEDRNAILAEAYFFRAYYYYRLVHQFGDVPYIGHEIVEPKLDFQTFTREAILQSIKEDLEFAVEWLPETVWAGKVNKAAGNHLLTKVYLSVREFDNAISSASEVINNGQYHLMTERFGNGRFRDDPEYDVLWDLHQKENISSEENKEKILVALRAYEMEGGGKGSTDMNRYWTPGWRMINGCEYNLANGVDELEGQLGRGNSYVRGSNYLNYDLANEDPNDLRYSKHNWWRIEDYWYNKPTFAKYGEQIDPKDVGIDTIAFLYPFFFNKCAVPQEKAGNYEGGVIDDYIFRLAETYLLRAEAYCWNGNNVKAAEDINTLRARANASQKSPSDITIDYVMDERARELFVEEPRNVELTRIAYIMASLNKDGYSMENMHENNWYYDRVMRTNNFFKEGITYRGRLCRIAPYHVYWAIPQEVIDANTDKVINQNLGYTGSGNNIPPKTEVTEED
jgi:starch-binding outer membrane protein, SusD/RagB family